MLLASSWADVALALVPTIAAAVAALIAYWNHKQMRTPSGTSIGKQVESAHHVALGNNYRLRTITGELNVKTSPQATREERDAEFLEPDGEAA